MSRSNSYFRNQRKLGFPLTTKEYGTFLNMMTVPSIWSGLCRFKHKSPYIHIWLADGDSLMCYIVKMSGLIAQLDDLIISSTGIQACYELYIHQLLVTSHYSLEEKILQDYNSTNMTDIQKIPFDYCQTLRSSFRGKLSETLDMSGN